MNTQELEENYHKLQWERRRPAILNLIHPLSSTCGDSLAARKKSEAAWNAPGRGCRWS
jgi:hypothetical protein